MATKGVARGLTSDELRELEQLIQDRIEEISLKEKEDAQKGNKYYEEMSDRINKARTRDDIANIYKDLFEAGKYVTQEQLTEIEDRLNAALDKLDDLKKRGEPEILTPEEQEEVELTKDEYIQKIDESKSLDDLNNLSSSIEASTTFDSKTKYKLLDMIKNKSTTFADIDPETEIPTVNTVFDLSNIDSMNAADFTSDLNDLTGGPAQPTPTQQTSSPQATPEDEKIQSAEDDMFDDISSCNINP